MGHEEVKELLRAAALAERPVHVLLWGPPALAKSLFLWDLEAALGEQARWVLGSSSSRAGLLEVLLERRPRLLLIDELDKMDGEDLATIAKNTIIFKVPRQDTPEEPVFQRVTTPTPLQQRAFELLGVALREPEKQGFRRYYPYLPPAGTLA